MVSSHPCFVVDDCNQFPIGLKRLRVVSARIHLMKNIFDSLDSSKRLMESDTSLPNWKCGKAGRAVSTECLSHGISTSRRMPFSAALEKWPLCSV